MEEQVHCISEQSTVHISCYIVYVLPLSRKTTKQKTECSHDMCQMSIIHSNNSCDKVTELLNMTWKMVSCSCL